MKKSLFISAIALLLVFTACNLGGGSRNGRMPGSNSGYTDEEINDIKDQNNPLRQGVEYFYSKSLDYSMGYPKSFVDFKKDGDKGFSCHSKDGYANLKVWGETTSSQIEDLLGNALSSFKSKGIEVSDYDLDDDAFIIQGADGDKGYCQRTILHEGKSATMFFDFSIKETDDFDPEAIYTSLGYDLSEMLLPGPPPVEATAKKADPNSIAQVAYVGEWHIFSTMRYEEPYKRYPEFKDVNSWEAQTGGEEVYLILATHEDTKITVKNNKTGERLYNKDSRPLVVRCNENGEPDMEITFICGDGRVLRYIPRHDANNHPILTTGLSDMTR